MVMTSKGKTHTNALTGSAIDRGKVFILKKKIIGKKNFVKLVGQ
jgi:hypothetical protein